MRPKTKLMSRSLSLIAIVFIGLTSLKAQKMDSVNIVGRWTSFDTVNKRTMAFQFNADSIAHISFGQGTIQSKYKLETEDGKLVLILQTPDNRTTKNIVRFISKSEIELYVSKVVDFNTNVKAWGINEFITLTRQPD